MMSKPEESNRSDNANPDPVDFGYRKVSPDDKPGMVQDLFAGVAGRYDVMNDAMSFGMHRIWKDAMVDWLAPRRGMKILDLAGGTGDIAFRIYDRVHGDADVTVCDFTEAMLVKGRERRKSKVEWVCGDGASLPFADASFEACTIAFGLRNVTDIDAVLREALRVLCFGGRFLCLEFGRTHPPAVAALYDAWSFEAIPRLGSMIAGDRDAYRYLVESIRKFPPQGELAARMRDAGYGRVSWRDMALGVAALHSGWRL